MKEENKIESFHSENLITERIRGMYTYIGFLHYVVLKSIPPKNACNKERTCFLRTNNNKKKDSKCEGGD